MPRETPSTLLGVSSEKRPLCLSEFLFIENPLLTESGKPTEFIAQARLTRRRSHYNLGRLLSAIRFLSSFRGRSALW